MVTVVTKASGFWMNGPRVRLCAPAVVARSTRRPVAARTIFTKGPPDGIRGKTRGAARGGTVHGSLAPVEAKSAARYPPGMVGRAAWCLGFLLMVGCSRTYQGTGDLIDRDRESATIAHDDIPGLMPAMVMRFPA